MIVAMSSMQLSLSSTVATIFKIFYLLFQNSEKI